MTTLMSFVAKLPKDQYIDILEVNAPSIDYTNKEVAQYTDIGMVYSGYVADLYLESECYLNKEVLKFNSVLNAFGDDYITVLIMKD
jgi:hypothetical protein